MPGAVTLWRIAVAGAALAAGIASIRDWSTRAPRSHPLSAVGNWWTEHPEIATERLMLDSALAARSGHSLDEQSKSRILSLARAEPLEPAPYMFAGALAQLDGESDRAERLYRAARLRDPRAPAVRLLLADLELRNGKIEQGLSNLIAIARISPAMAAPVVPALAQFAQTPGAIGKMRAAFASNPNLRGLVLHELATDPANSPLIFALAPESTRSAREPTEWQQRLINTTYTSGKAHLAREYWLRFNDLREAKSEPVFNSDFRQIVASPPFNWTFISGTAGIAELAPGGGLSIVHFGREPAHLARQLLTVDPGIYSISSEFGGRFERGRIEWRVQCLVGGQAQAVSASPEGGTFRIGQGCSGVWLDLFALPSESEARLDAKLRRVDVRKVG